MWYRGAVLVILLGFVAGPFTPATPAAAVENEISVLALASTTPAGTGGNGSSVSVAVGSWPWVAFSSFASDLVPGDTNGKTDVFVRNLLTGETQRLKGLGGAEPNGDSFAPVITAGTPKVVFESSASNLVAGDTNNTGDVFMWNIATGVVTRVSVSDSEQQGDNLSTWGSVDKFGAKVAFTSYASNLTGVADTNGKQDVFVRDLGAGTTERVTVTSAAVALTAGGTQPSIAPDGASVAFQSDTNQVGTDTNGRTDIFVRDLGADTTTRVSVAQAGAQGNGNSSSPSMGLGGDIAFQTAADNLSNQPDTDDSNDIVFRDGSTGFVHQVSITDDDTSVDAWSYRPVLSETGRRVLFQSEDPGLVPDDGNGVSDVFLRDITAGTTTRVSSTATGAAANGESIRPSFSRGRNDVWGFTSEATDLTPADTNANLDALVRMDATLGPFTTPEQIVARQYADFLGRFPTAAEMAAGAKAIRSGTRFAEALVDDLAHADYDNFRGPILRQYWAFFDRVPDQGGYTYWLGQYAILRRSLQSIANFFAQSNEFKNTYGALSDVQFVTLVYQNVLNRAPDTAGQAYWLGRLAGGTTRGAMMAGFAESPEGRKLVRQEVDVMLLYEAMLRRIPGPAEHVDQLDDFDGFGEPTEDYVRGLLESVEYADRFD